MVRLVYVSDHLATVNVNWHGLYFLQMLILIVLRKPINIAIWLINEKRHLFTLQNDNWRHFVKKLQFFYKRIKSIAQMFFDELIFTNHHYQLHFFQIIFLSSIWSCALTFSHLWIIGMDFYHIIYPHQHSLNRHYVRFDVRFVMGTFWMVN